MLDEGLLENAQALALREGLDGLDLPTLDVQGEHHAGISRGAIKVNDARTTGAAVADFLGAGGIEVRTKGFKQGCASFDLELNRFAIEFKTKLGRFETDLSGATRRSLRCALWGGAFGR